MSIDVLVHVGGTLLLAPLLPFLEKGLTRRVVQKNKRIVQQQTAGLREQVDSLATRIDQLRRLSVSRTPRTSRTRTASSTR